MLWFDGLKTIQQSDENIRVIEGEKFIKFKVLKSFNSFQDKITKKYLATDYVDSNRSCNTSLSCNACAWSSDSGNCPKKSL